MNKKDMKKVRTMQFFKNKKRNIKGKLFVFWRIKSER